MRNWIGRMIVVFILALFAFLALCQQSDAGELSIAGGIDVAHASGDPMLFLRYDITLQWGVYTALAGGEHEAFGVGVDYTVHGAGSLSGWLARFGAVGWNRENALNGSPLDFGFAAERSFGGGVFAGVYHSSAGSALGFTDRSNYGRNVFYLRKGF